MRINLNNNQHGRLLDGHLVMLWNTDLSDLVEANSHIVINDYHVFVNSASLVKTEKPPVQRLTVKIAGACSVIESTEKERQAYALAMMHELELVEKAKRKQVMCHPWIAVNDLYARIQDGLLCTFSECDALLQTLAGVHLEVFRTGKFVRVMGDRVCQQ